MRQFLLALFFAVNILVVWAANPTPGLMRKCRRPGEVKGPGGRQCRAQIPSWRWDDQKRECVQFMFTGCNGTDNLFPTKEKCLEACQEMSKVTPCPPLADAPKTDCKWQTVVTVENGCQKHFVHCPDRETLGNCTVDQTDRKAPFDCDVLYLKDGKGCEYAVFDCTNGPPEQPMNL